jgi:hypothetical protein
MLREIARVILIPTIDAVKKRQRIQLYNELGNFAGPNHKSTIEKYISSYQSV